MTMIMGKERQSILRRLWRKISGRRSSNTIEEQASASLQLPGSKRVGLPKIAHISSFSSTASSTSPVAKRPVISVDERTWRCASMPVTKLEPFQSSMGHRNEHDSKPQLPCNSLNSSTVAIGNDTKLVDIVPEKLTAKRPYKIPQSKRRRTIELGDTMARTTTMTDGCLYITSRPYLLLIIPYSLRECS